MMRFVMFLPEAMRRDLIAALDEIAERFQMGSLDDPEWYFPDTRHWLVLARFDQEILEQYREPDRELVRAEVGAAPSSILSFMLNQREIGKAGNAARTVVVHLLTRFYGIVDDCCADHSLWNLEEILHTKRGTEFLACHR